MLEKEKIKEQRLEIEREIKQIQEVQECSFKPKIILTSSIVAFENVQICLFLKCPIETIGYGEYIQFVINAVD